MKTSSRSNDFSVPDIAGKCTLLVFADSRQAFPAKLTLHQPKRAVRERRRRAVPVAHVRRARGMRYQIRSRDAFGAIEVT